MNNKYKILMIESDDAAARRLSALLAESGYKAVTARSCHSGKMIFSSHRPDLVLVDLELPDADGMAFLREVRRDSSVPVIVLSDRGEEKDIIEALDGGANDYITKPLREGEFLARIRASLRNVRRAGAAELPEGFFAAGSFSIDYGARRVMMGEREIRLTQTEYNILALLSEHPGKVLTYSFMGKAIWGYYDSGSTKKLQVNMANIRKKIPAEAEKDGLIINEPGVGYCMTGR